MPPVEGCWGQCLVRGAIHALVPVGGPHLPALPAAHLVVHKAHVPRVQRCGPLAAVARVHGSGQLLQRPLVVGVELVGQRQVQLLGARLHGAVCKTGYTQRCPPSALCGQDGYAPGLSSPGLYTWPPCLCSGAPSAGLCHLAEFTFRGAGWVPADSIRKCKRGGSRDVDFRGCSGPLSL